MRLYSSITCGSLGDIKKLESLGVRIRFNNATCFNTACILYIHHDSRGIESITNKTIVPGTPRPAFIRAKTTEQDVGHNEEAKALPQDFHGGFSHLHERFFSGEEAFTPCRNESKELTICLNFICAQYTLQAATFVILVLVAGGDD